MLSSVINCLVGLQIVTVYLDYLLPIYLSTSVSGSSSQGSGRIRNEKIYFSGTEIETKRNSESYRRSENDITEINILVNNVMVWFSMHTLC